MFWRCQRVCSYQIVETWRMCVRPATPEVSVWGLCRGNLSRLQTHKVGFRAGTEVGQAQFVCDVCQEGGSLAFTAAGQLEHNNNPWWVSLDDNYYRASLQKHIKKHALRRLSFSFIPSHGRPWALRQQPWSSLVLGHSGPWPCRTPSRSS